MILPQKGFELMTLRCRSVLRTHREKRTKYPNE